MRRALLASLAVALLIAPSATAQGRSHPREIKEWLVRKHPDFQEQSWTIQGKQTALLDVAKEDALEKAQAKVIDCLLEQDPPVRWVPPISFIKRELVKDISAPGKGEVFKGVEPKICEVSIDRHRAFEEKWEVKDPDIKEFHRVTLNVTITPEAWQKIQVEQRNDLQRQRNLVMKQRMLLLLKIMGGLVVLLATVAGYIRLDEWSKGYYTNWLRLAALSCVGVVAAAGWWLFLAN